MYLAVKRVFVIEGCEYELRGWIHRRFEGYHEARGGGVMAGEGVLLDFWKVERAGYREWDEVMMDERARYGDINKKWEIERGGGNETMFRVYMCLGFNNGLV